jgi:hypothetical protein
VEFKTSKGESLAISVPRTGVAVIQHFQERMPNGLFAPEPVPRSAKPSTRREPSKTLRIIKEVLKEAQKKKLLVMAPKAILEAARVTVGRYTARRDQPHFQGDEYHGHADIPGGYEVSWNISGSRRHPGKFPAQIPADARAAVANVLGVDPTKLEGYRVDDDRNTLLIEVKN